MILSNRNKPKNKLDKNNKKFENRLTEEQRNTFKAYMNDSLIKENNLIINKMFKLDHEGSLFYSSEFVEALNEEEPIEGIDIDNLNF